MSLRWLYQIRILSRSLSAKAALYCIGAVAAALVAVVFADFVPDGLASLLGGDAVDHILTILASSMLAVVTFSLSTLVATYSTVAAGAPPRATSLVIEDSQAQKALSSFLGAFIFSIVALVALSTKYYGEKGRVILFFITILVLFAVIWTIIRWIGQLSQLGRLGNVIEEVERATVKCVEGLPRYFEWQSPRPRGAPPSSLAVVTKECGFIQAIDYCGLERLADENNLNIFVESGVGQFVTPDFILARMESSSHSELIEKIKKCFFLGNIRTFDEDPRFGLIVLSEIASRALSPAINDPGTAIQVLSSLTRILFKLKALPALTRDKTLSARLHIRRITADELFDDSFRAISRDGASCLEVVVFLQKALAALSRHSEFREAALAKSKESLLLSEDKIPMEADIKRLRAAAGSLLSSES